MPFLKFKHALNDFLNQIDKDIEELKLKESYYTISKLEAAVSNSLISQPEEKELMAKIFYLKGLATHNGIESKGV